MRGTKGKCPGCDAEGTVGTPCQEKGCKKRGLHYLTVGHWQRAHPSEDSLPDPVLGQMVGDFLVVDLIGAGGFGKVYLAFQSPLLRLKGALKLIDISTEDPEFSKALLHKFQSEAEVLAHLTHPNIVRLLKYGIHSRRPYLVMEYVDKGKTLRAEIHQRNGAFTGDEVISIFDQILNGLGAAHEESIIHRDIKPENIMLQSVVGNPHHVRLLDFGLAKFVEHRNDTRWHLGSPNYMAPEQISRENLGPWTDLYAVTVMAFEFLTGRRPFPGRTEEEVLVKKVKEDFDPLDEVADLELPEEVLEFLGKGLARDPEDRYQDVDTLRVALKAAVESLGDRILDLGTVVTDPTAYLDSEALNDAIIEAGEDLPAEPRVPAQDEETRVGVAGGDRSGDLDSEAAPGGMKPKEPSGPVNDEETRVGPPAKEPSMDVEVSANGETAREEAAREESDEEEAAEEPRSTKKGTFGLAAVVVTVVVVIIAVANLSSEDEDPIAVEEALAAVADLDEEVIAEPAEELADDPDVGVEEEFDPDVDLSPMIFVDAGEEEVDPLAPRGRIVDIAVGKFHTCVLLRDGDVRCWGQNSEGELGLGHRRTIGHQRPASSSPFVYLGEPAVAIAAAGDHQASFTCAILESGALRCWGSNHFGQLGLGTDLRRTGDRVPGEFDPVDLGGEAKMIALGAMQYATHACAVLVDGAVRCWGNNRYGQLGLGHTRHIGQSEVPANVNPVEVGGEVVAIDAGKFHTCVLLEGGDVRCWGRNQAGQLGYGHTENVGDTELPTDVGTVDVGGEVKAISLGRSHTCALLEGGRARCWGWNSAGQLGYGHTDNIGDQGPPSEAGDIDAGGEILQISAGGLHTCALLEEGRVRCWGDNRFGQLGYGHRHRIGDTELPRHANDVHLGGRAVAIRASNYHTCALLEDDTLRCWGFNDFGQLGYGHTDYITTTRAPASAGPVPVFSR